MWLTPQCKRWEQTLKIKCFILVFPFFGLLNLSNFLKYWSSFLTTTGTNYVPVSILKFIPVHTI